MQSRKQRPPIEELVFIDDFFRVAENGLPPSPENRKFLRAFFGTGASRLGWRVRELSVQSQRGSICVPKIMESLGLSSDRAGWAAACVADLQPAAEHLAMLALTPASLVIGWGLTPAIMQYVDNQGAAFIDVEIDSIRFTRDLHLAVRTNDPGIREELEHLRIDEETFWSNAAGLRGHFARRGHSSIVNADLSVGLFVGQTSVDLALIGGGRLAQPADFIEPIRQWAQQVDLLAIRPHPAQADTRQFDVLLDSIPNALLIKHNTYKPALRRQPGLRRRDIVRRAQGSALSGLQRRSVPACRRPQYRQPAAGCRPSALPGFRCGSKWPVPARWKRSRPREASSARACPQRRPRRLPRTRSPRSSPTVGGWTRLRAACPNSRC
ncbi:hypothetical protein [Burkholderia gladioli]|uniref:hypothetical protein n=1 Tax=Burkholderia gladioli TaxID=28095 RepID=UPI0016401FCD|nr:hypothetical protein [Burkholderia gladioli]